MLAKMRNMGEACTAANRFLVHEDVADEFASRFAARMEAEVVRDSLLYLAGSLDLQMGGPEIDETKGQESRRRSVYSSGAERAPPRPTPVVGSTRGDVH